MYGAGARCGRHLIKASSRGSRKYCRAGMRATAGDASVGPSGIGSSRGSRGLQQAQGQRSPGQQHSPAGAPAPPPAGFRRRGAERQIGRAFGQEPHRIWESARTSASWLEAGASVIGRRGCRSYRVLLARKFVYSRLRTAFLEKPFPPLASPVRALIIPVTPPPEPTLKPECQLPHRPRPPTGPHNRSHCSESRPQLRQPPLASSPRAPTPLTIHTTGLYASSRL